LLSCPFALFLSPFTCQLPKKVRGMMKWSGERTIEDMRTLTIM
jgi:hypothetical protein